MGKRGRKGPGAVSRPRRKKSGWADDDAEEEEEKVAWLQSPKTPTAEGGVTDGYHPTTMAYCWEESECASAVTGGDVQGSSQREEEGAEAGDEPETQSMEEDEREMVEVGNAKVVEYIEGVPIVPVTLHAMKQPKTGQRLLLDSMAVAVLKQTKPVFVDTPYVRSLAPVT